MGAFRPMPQEAAVRVIVSLFREFELAARDGVMTMPQYRLLLFLRRGPRRAGELAALAEVKKPTITPLIASLEEQGWAERATDDTDRRSARLTLTDAGSAAMDTMEERLGAVLARYIPADAQGQMDAAVLAIGGALMTTQEQRFQWLRDDLVDAPFP